MANAIIHAQEGQDGQRSGACGLDVAEPWTFGACINATDNAGTSAGHTYQAPHEARTCCDATHLFVPKGIGGMSAYNLNATGNNPAALWTVAPASFVATPAYDAATDSLWAGGTNGTIYKLNPLTGATIGTYVAGGGSLRKAPLIANGFVYFVGFDGKLTCIATSASGFPMALTWTYTPVLATVTNPINGVGRGSTPAAYSSSRDCIIYGTDDLFVHAVTAATGIAKWRVKPTTSTPGGIPDNTNWFGGNTYERGWPVVAEIHGYVMIRLQISGGSYLQILPTGNPMNLAWASQAAIQSFLVANPQAQSFFVMSLDTGAAPAWTPAVLYTYEETAGTPSGNAGLIPHPPSVKVWPNGDEVVYTTFRQGVRDRTVNTGASLSASGTTVTVTVANDILEYGANIEIAGASDARYNGVWRIIGNATPTSFTFTHTISGLPPASAATVYQWPQDWRWDGHMGEMVLDSTTVPGLPAGNFRFMAFEYPLGAPAPGYANGIAYSFINDEQSPQTIMGSTLLRSHWAAFESAILTDRSTSKGLTFENPMPMTRHPVIGFNQGSPPSTSFNFATHVTTDSVTNGKIWFNPSTNDGRFYSYTTPSNFFVYWNASPMLGGDSGPENFLLPNAGAWGRHAYSTATGGFSYLITQGDAGELGIWKTSTVASVAPVTTIGTITPVSSTVATRAKYEATFPITGSTETKWLRQKYADASAPVGVPQGTGLTVTAQVLPPGVVDWALAKTHRCQWWVDYAYTTQTWNGATTQHYYPSNTGTWHFRFAPSTAGVWSYRIQVVDGNGTAISGTQTLTATLPVANKGILRVSPSDGRYFTREDGSYVPILGLQENVVPADFNRATADTKIAGLVADGVNATRQWMSASTVCGGGWAPLVNFNHPTRSSVNGAPGLIVPPTLPVAYEPNSKLTYELNRAYANPPILVYGFNHGPIGVKPSQAYRLTLIARTQGVVASGGHTLGTDAGLTVKFLGQNIGAYAAAVPGATARTPYLASDTWSTIANGGATYTTGASEYFLGCPTGGAGDANFTYVVLENTSAGTAYVYDLLCQEDLGGGNFGPNLFWKACADSLFRDVGDLASAAWDYSFDQCAASDLFVKPVVLETADEVWGMLTAAGGTTSTYDGTNFNSGPNTQNRFWQALAAEYVSARWGYSPAIFAWEHVNETGGGGGVNNAPSYDSAGAFVTALHGADMHKHLGSTSVGTASPLHPDLWSRPESAAQDITDVHAYISTGLDAKGFEWDPQSNMTLDPSGAVWIAAGAAAPNTSPSIPIQGQGTWTFQCDMKPVGVNAANDGSTLYGPQVFWQVVDSAGANITNSPRVLPDTAAYFTGTGPIGTAGYVTYSATINVPTTAWYTFNCDFRMTHAASGVGWYTNLKLFDPAGRQWRVVGDGTFLDRVDTWNDTSYQAQVYGRLWGAKAANGVRNKPLVRGEFSMDGPLGTTMRGGGPLVTPTADEAYVMQQDLKGIWLHTFLWGHLDPGGLHDFFWYWDGGPTPAYSITQNNLFFQIRNYLSFAKLLPLGNGNYQDLFPSGSAAPSSATTFVVGQKDTVNNAAHFWVRNTSLKWPNAPGVPGAGTITSPVGTLPLAIPSGSYTVDLWLFDVNGALTSAAGTLLSTNGLATMDLGAVTAAHPGLTDFGVRLSSVASGGSVTTVNYKASIRDTTGVLRTGLTPAFINAHLRSDVNAIITAPAVTELNATDCPGVYVIPYDPVVNGDAVGVLNTGLASPFDKLEVNLTREAALLITNLDAPVSTATGLGLTAQGYTVTRAGYLDTLNGLVAAATAGVWNAVATSYNTALSMGSKLNAAASSGDPWTTAVPGAYGTGTAGNLLGNLVATILDAANGIETGVTVRQAIRQSVRVLAGKVSGAGTTNLLIRNLADTKNAVNATVDAAGDRTSVTNDFS